MQIMYVYALIYVAEKFLMNNMKLIDSPAPFIGINRLKEA